MNSPYNFTEGENSIEIPTECPCRTKICYRSCQQQVVAEYGMKSTISHQLWPIDQNYSENLFSEKNFINHRCVPCKIVVPLSLLFIQHNLKWATFITFRIISNRRISSLHILHNIFFYIFPPQSHRSRIFKRFFFHFTLGWTVDDICGALWIELLINSTQLIEKPCHCRARQPLSNCHTSTSHSNDFFFLSTEKLFLIYSQQPTANDISSVSQHFRFCEQSSSSQTIFCSQSCHEDTSVRVERKFERENPRAMKLGGEIVWRCWKLFQRLVYASLYWSFGWSLIEAAFLPDEGEFFACEIEKFTIRKTFDDAFRWQN